MASHSTITIESVKQRIASKSGREAILQVREDEALAVVNLLDQILIKPGLRNKQRTRCLVTLQKLCGTFCILPDSHILSDGLDIISASPVACGGFADVYRGSYKGLSVAVKTLRIPEAKQLELPLLKKPLFKEAAGWKHLEHPNVLPFLGALVQEFSLSLVSAWMENGDINQYIRSNPEANRLQLLADVASGIEYLHSVKIVHADLKGANVLISTEGRALLADFGLINVISDSSATCADTSAQVGGTTRWMSPELLSPEYFGLLSIKPTVSSDVYALGMVILEVLTGARPFADVARDYTIVIHVVVNGKRPIRPVDSINMGISDALWRLMQGCWRLASEGRPAVGVLRQSLQHAAPGWASLPHGQARSQGSRGVPTQTDSSTSSAEPNVTSKEGANAEIDPEAIARRSMYGSVDFSSLTVVPTIVSGVIGWQTGGSRTEATQKRPPSPSISLMRRSQLLLQTTSVYHRMRGLRDLERGISMHQASLKLHPPGHKDRPETLKELRGYLRKRFDQGSDMIDLDMAIESGMELLELCPLGHRDHRRALANLGSDLRARFAKKDDVEDLRRATQLRREYLRLSPAGHPDHSVAEQNLLSDLKTCVDRNQDPEDLDWSIELHHELLQLCPQGNSNRSMALNKLGSALQSRFDQAGNIQDLEDAITLRRECLELRPPGYPNRLKALNKLGSALQSRFFRTGDARDLEHAIELHGEELKRSPLGHSHRSTALNMLGSALQIRFDQKGAIYDLERAIELHSEELKLRPPGHPHRSAALNMLGSALKSRISYQGNLEDLEHAIRLHREELELSPPGHPDRSKALNLLGSALKSLSDRTGAFPDLEYAIELHREELELRSLGHPHRSAALNMLGSALRSRFAHKGDIEDLEDAITMHHEVLKLNPPGHPDRFTALTVLGSALMCLFDHKGSLGDLDHAIELYREGLGLCPSHKHLKTLKALESMLQQREAHLKQFPV